MKNYVTYNIELIEENAEKLDKINSILFGDCPAASTANDNHETQTEDKKTEGKKRKRRTKAEMDAGKERTKAEETDANNDEDFAEEKVKSGKKLTAQEVIHAVRGFSKHEDHSKPEAKGILSDFGLDSLGEVATLDQTDLQKLYKRVQV